MSQVPLALNIGLTDVPHPAGLVPFLNQVAELICEVFEDCGKNFKWLDAGMGGYVVLRGDLDPVHKIKMTIGEEATTAILYKNPEGQPVQEILRLALRNCVWSDFQGWVFQAKTDYDHLISKSRLYHVVKSFGIFDDPSQKSVRFKAGDTVEISGDSNSIRLNFGANKGPWIRPNPRDHISGIQRMLRKGCLRPVR